MPSHFKEVEKLFDHFASKNEKLSSENESVIELLKIRFNTAKTRFGDLNLDSLSIKKLPYLQERALRNLHKGDFVDFFNLSILIHYIISAKKDN